MNEFPFCDAVLPARPVILRLPMRAYSVGHELLLAKERNALFMLTAGDFLQLPLNARVLASQRAAMICARTWAENFEEAKGFRKWSRMLTQADYDAAPEFFRNYRAAGSTFPRGPQETIDEVLNGERGRLLGGELLPALVNFLTKSGVRGAERRTGGDPFAGNVFDFPFGMGLHLYFTDLEMSGHRRIENEEERQGRLERDAAIADVPEANREALKHLKSRMQGSKPEGPDA